MPLFLLFVLHTTWAFYLPGVAPRDYVMGEQVALKVNALDSTHTQLPYDYYSLPFCKPDQIMVRLVLVETCRVDGTFIT